MDIDETSVSSVLSVDVSSNPSVDYSHKDIRTKIINGEYKLLSKCGKSKVWEVYALIQNGNGEEFDNVVACKNCKNVFKLNKKSTSNLLKHKCYLISRSARSDKTTALEVDSETKKQCVCVVTEWVIENCRSFKMMEDSGLKKFATFLISVGANNGENVDVDNLLPHPTTVSRNIAKLYDKYFDKVKTEVNIKNGYGVTTDLWTDNYLKMSYLAVTIHYVKDGELECRLLALKSMEGEKSTGENIKMKVAKTLADFNCDLSEKAIVVTDRGANMISAFRLCNHMFCINHLLNNAVEKSIKDTPEIAELSNICTKLVKYFKKSGINSKLHATLKSFCPTRWNTIFYLLSSIEKNWAEITSILQEKKEMKKIDNINLSYIHAVVKLLSSFEETSKKLEGENYATLHWVYIHIHRLKKICTVNLEDLDVIKSFKDKLHNYINEVVLKHVNIYHKIALFLFPPTNKLKQFIEDEKNVVKAECKKLMRSYIQNVSGEDEDMPSTSKISSFNSELLTDFLQEPAALNSDDKIDHEIRLYENTDVVFHDDFNILQWWNSHRAEFPLLYKVSCKLLATPASSAASERVFSMARNLISEKRSLIGTNSATINQIMFLHFNMAKTIIKSELDAVIN